MAAGLAVGTWEFEKSENFDEYMKAVGVGMAKRAIANKLKPKQEIKIENGNWTITSSSTFTTTVINFQIGVPFDETTADGRKVRTTANIDGNKLIHSQKGEIDSVITRDFSKDGFLMTLQAKGVTCLRTYKRK